MDAAELKRRYGSKLVNRHLIPLPRKYFDSGEYALDQAGRSGSLGGSVGVDLQHPLPENIPHPAVHNPILLSSANGPAGAANPASPIGPAVQDSLPTSIAALPRLSLPPGSLHSRGIFPGHIGLTSPVRERSILQCETSIDDVDDSDETPTDAKPALESAPDPASDSASSGPSPRPDGLPFRP